MATTTKRKSRKSTTPKVSRRVQSMESLNRARSGSCPKNEAAVRAHFMARGIPLDQIQPRENVLTFHAWKALGRSVRKGERGCKILTWIPYAGKAKQDQDQTDSKESKPSKGGGLKRKATTVFHISQTHPTGHKDGAEPLPLHPDQVAKSESVAVVDAPRFGGSQWTKAAIERRVIETAEDAGWAPGELERHTLANGDLVDFSFPSTIPAEIAEGLEGESFSTRRWFKGNTPTGTGLDSLSELGADALISIAREFGRQGITGARAYLESLGNPEHGLILFLAEARASVAVRDLPPMIEIQTPPIGSLFDLCGQGFTVADQDGEPVAVPTDGYGVGFALPRGMMPIDAKTLILPGEDADSTLPPF